MLVRPVNACAAGDKTRCQHDPSGLCRAHAVLFTDFTIGRFRGLRAGVTRLASHRTSSSNSTAVVSAWQAACNDRRAAVNVLGKTEEAARNGVGLELEDGLGAVFSGAITTVGCLRFDGRCKGVTGDLSQKSMCKGKSTGSRKARFCPAVPSLRRL